MFTCHICNKRTKKAYYCIDESEEYNLEFYGLKGVIAFENIEGEHFTYWEVQREGV